MALDALRQPLEEGRVEIMRGQRTLEFPANAILVAACNRCPCGRSADRCRCAAGERDRYLRRLSGPLLDRLDLVCEVRAVPAVELVAGGVRGPSSAAVSERGGARARAPAAAARGTGALCNGDMDGRLTRRSVRLDADARAGLWAHESARTERPRPRPGAAGRADDRGSRRPGAVARRTSRRRSPIASTAGSGWRHEAPGGGPACDSVCGGRDWSPTARAAHHRAARLPGGPCTGLLALADEDLIAVLGAAGSRRRETVSPVSTRPPSARA